ncbi:hypothetical protein EOA23_01125 [Mesorhizobium sp. M2A.F.Ca.ET.042.01.1.1]|uniref:hypothetical protein n=1 Tax=Mesorhizobium sp. M2A.F.Ca.ET.042.01.1.1 TaxID=2496745 RepID=UPI000FCAAF6A|nr:hypothetical protein [Mesorhizobium sp. M2A.F.Ca.ET.042.01.1.1]RUX34680.1 hypothetical protein EOA23_01125 [Mesorhizobium sp. M2A.F.Ca.ET.042.01.1.1]
MASFGEMSVRELARLWDEGMTSGRSVDANQAFARIKSKLDAKIAETRAAMTPRLQPEAEAMKRK